jgi:hypothetical protein
MVARLDAFRDVFMGVANDIRNELMAEMRNGMREHFKLLEEKFGELCTAAAAADAPNVAVEGDHNTTNNNSHNTTTNNINITVNAFGKEDTSYIPPATLERCAKECNQGVIDLARMVYFNPKRPENHTIEAQSEKQLTEKGYVRIRDKEGGWSRELRDTAFKQMWLAMFGMVNRLYAAWEYEDIIEQMVGGAVPAARIKAFMNMGEDFRTKDSVRGQLPALPANLTKPIERMLLQQMDRAKGEAKAKAKA